MKITLDRFGRIVVPKEIRDRLGLGPGAEIEIDEKENEVVLKPVEHEPSLMVKEGVLVYSGKATGDLKGTVRRISCCRQTSERSGDFRRRRL
jgi:AbrB family looped-hinge helix DNA binding protein